MNVGGEHKEISKQLCLSEAQHQLARITNNKLIEILHAQQSNVPVHVDAEVTGHLGVDNSLNTGDI